MIRVPNAEHRPAAARGVCLLAISGNRRLAVGGQIARRGTVAVRGWLIRQASWHQALADGCGGSVQEAIARPELASANVCSGHPYLWERDDLFGFQQTAGHE